MKLLLIFVGLLMLAPTEGTEKDFLRLYKAVASLESENRELKSRINSLETLSKNGIGKVASFQVQQSGGNLPLGHKEVLKFDDVRVNTGNAYNPRSGIFIAPVTGTYLFWANIMSRDSNWFPITLQREGKEICRGYTGYKVPNGVATITYMTKLTKGDHVWFANVLHSKTTVYGGRYSNYGGTLLYV